MAITTYNEFNDDDPEKAKDSIRNMFGPQAVDNSFRQAITTCWMMLPDDKKNIANIEAEVRRIVDRALQNLREDAKSFGIPPE
ncbi:MAG: hypothetical protein AB7O26_20060 [Planctomycetaceae bacterium]